MAQGDDPFAKYEKAPQQSADPFKRYEGYTSTPRRRRKLAAAGLPDAANVAPEELARMRTESRGMHPSLRSRALETGIALGHVPVDIAGGLLEILKTAGEGYREIGRAGRSLVTGDPYVPHEELTGQRRLPGGQLEPAQPSLSERGVESLIGIPAMGYHAQARLQEALGDPRISGGEPESYGDIVRAAGNVAVQPLLFRGQGRRGAGEVLRDVARPSSWAEFARRRQLAGQITPTQRAEPRVVVPQNAPAERVASTAEAIQGLGEHAERVRPPREPLGDETARDWVAPDAEQVLRQPVADPFVEYERGERAKQTEPDRLRDVPDEALGEAPPPEKSFNDQALEQRVREVAPRVLEAERRKEQIPVQIERRAAPAEPPTQGERRAPGDRRYDETTLVEEERRTSERRGATRPILGRILPPEKVVGEVPAHVGRLTNADMADTQPSAVRTRDGQIFRGGEHGDAFNKAVDAGALNAEAELGIDYETGFIRRDGQFNPRPSTEFPPLPELEGPALDPAQQARIAQREAQRTAKKASLTQRIAEAAPIGEPPKPVRSTSDVQPPSEVPLGKPPEVFPTAEPKVPIDLESLDRQVAAERAANERLKAEKAKLPKPVYETSQERATRMRENRRKAVPEADRRVTELLRERAHLRNELAGYPEGGRPRPELKERIRSLKEQIDEINRELGEPIEYTRRSKEKRGFGLNEKGFLNLFGSNKRALAQPSAAERARLGSDVTKVLDRVAVGERAPMRGNVWQTMKRWIFETSATARGLERAAKKAGRTLPVEQRPLLWFKAALDSPTRVGGWLLDEGAGPGRWTSKGNWELTGTPAFETALKPIKGNAVKVSQWRARLVAERVPEVISARLKALYEAAQAAKKQGKFGPAAQAEYARQRGRILGGSATSGITLRQAQAAINAPASPDVLLAVEHSRAILNDALQYGVDAGAYTPQLAQALREAYEHYVPYQRAFEGEGAVRSGSGGPLSPKGPVRRLVGSEERIVDPAETIPDYVARMVRYADIYRAARSTIDLIEAHPDLFEGMAKKIGSQPLTSTGQATQALGSLLSDRALALEGDRIQLANSRTGTLDTYRVDPSISDALKGLGTKEYGLFVELLAGLPKKTVTFGVTNNPVFAWIINPIRDALGRPTMSVAGHGPKGLIPTYPGEHSLRAFGQAVFETPEFKRYRSMGGGFGLQAESGGFLGQAARAIGGRGRRVGAQLAGQDMASRLVGGVTAGKIVRSPVDFLKAMSLPFEQGGRFAEFRTVKRSARSVYGDEAMSDLEAHMHTQEALGNFAEHGTSAAMRLLAHTVPFFNPALQGARAFAGAAARNPAKFAAAGLLTITLPTLALYKLNENDEEIQEMRKGPGGYLYWYFRVPDKPWVPEKLRGEVLKAPKPFGPGAMWATAPEHALDAAKEKDPHAFRRGWNDFWKEMLPGFVPPVAATAYSFGANRDISTGTPIVPNEQLKRAPAYQEGRHPSPTINRLVQNPIGEALRIRPARLKYGVRQFGGTGAGETLNVLDRALYGAEMPSPAKADLPFVGRMFGRYPTSAAASIRDVYDEANPSAEVLATIQGLASKGQASKLTQYLEAHSGEIARSGVSTEVIKELSQLADAAELLEVQGNAAGRDRLLHVMISLAQKLHPLLDTLAQRERQR